MLFKRSVKAPLTVKSAFKTNAEIAHFGVYEQVFRIVHAEGISEIGKAYADRFFQIMRNVAFAIADRRGNIGDRFVFVEMLGEVLDKCRNHVIALRDIFAHRRNP